MAWRRETFCCKLFDTLWFRNHINIITSHSILFSCDYKLYAFLSEYAPLCVVQHINGKLGQRKTHNPWMFCFVWVAFSLNGISPQHEVTFFHNCIIYLFMATLDFHCFPWAFSSGEQGLLFVVLYGLLIAVASLVIITGSRCASFSSCSPQAQ